MALAELTYKRTRTAKHFLDLDTGKKVAHLYTHDVHYQDETGAWQETAETFEAGTIAGFAHKMDKLRHALHGADDGGRRWYPRRNVDEYVEFGQLQYKPTGPWAQLPLGTPIRQNGTLTWTRPNYTLTLTVNWRKVKINLVLNNSTAAKPIRWAVSLHGLAYSQSTGALTSIADGIVVGYVDKPVAWDARVTPGTPEFVPNIPVSASYSGGYITFTADLTGAQYPVTIDPTLNTYDSSIWADDVCIDQGNPDTNMPYANYASLYSAGRILRSVLKWDLSSLAGATITSATAYLYNSTGGVRAEQEFRRILSPNTWVEAQATWNNRSTGNAWAGSAGCSSSGTDYSATSMSDVTFPYAATSLDGGERTSTLDTTEFAAMVADNYGVLYKAVDETTIYAGAPQRDSEDATTAYRPKLVVVYTTGGVAYLRNVNEIVDIAEATRRALAFKRKQAETVNISEAQQKAATWLRLIAETVNLSEASRRLMALRRTVAETLNILETNKAALALSRGIAETVDISEAVHKAATWLRLVAETVQIGEASNRAMTLARTVAETVHISEAVGRLGALVQRIAETLNISEAADSAFAQAQALVKWANETLNIREVISIAKWPFGHLRIDIPGRRYLATAVGRLYRVRNNQS